MVDSSKLDAEELAAIRGAIGQALSAAVSSTHTSSPDAMPVALIADDSAGERARPDGLRIVNRWLPLARMRLLRGFGVKVELTTGHAETIAGSFLRDELSSSWTRVL